MKVSLYGADLSEELFLGNFKDNRRQGKGEMTYANGDKYMGDWVEDNWTGQSVYIFANGDMR